MPVDGESTAAAARTCGSSAWNRAERDLLEEDAVRAPPGHDLGEAGLLLRLHREKPLPDSPEGDAVRLAEPRQVPVSLGRRAGP